MSSKIIKNHILFSYILFKIKIKINIDSNNEIDNLGAAYLAKGFQKLQNLSSLIFKIKFKLKNKKQNKLT